MKHLPYILIALLLAVNGVSFAQQNIGVAYLNAIDMNDRQEYLKAAQMFTRLQERALAERDTEIYINSVLAAGECYYMLNITTQMKVELDKAKAAYAQYALYVKDSLRLIWAKDISKLDGSYKYCMFDADLCGPYEPENAYKRCLAILDTLRQLSSYDGEVVSIYDDQEAEAEIHRELLSLYYRLGDYEKALQESYFVYDFYSNFHYAEKPRVPADYRYNRTIVDAVLSHAMALARLQQFDRAEEALSVLPKACSKVPSVLRTKGKILMMRSDVDGVDRRGEAMGYYDQYIKIQKQRLNKEMDHMTDAQRELYWLNLHDFLTDCYRLGDRATEMLYDLALFSKGYLLEYQNKKAKLFTWKDIQKCLGANSCAVEFVQYNGKDDKKLLGAMVVTSKSKKPVFVPISDLESLRRTRVTRSLDLHRAVISTKPDDKNELYTDTALFGKIWTAELMAATDGATHIYFAADGILQQLAIEYMMPDTTRRCHRLTSTRMLAKEHKPLDTRKMLLFGGIDYAVRVEPADQDNDEQAYVLFQPHIGALVNLPGTKAEVDTVLVLRHAEGDMALYGRDATDSAFCTAAPHFPIVLVSTHGFFLGDMLDGTDMRPPISDHAMSESGLAFAGCRYSLTDSTHDAALPDGVLSARELSKLSLDSTGLVVLSACQTGLGTITADGVYGVQRALKQAGVRALIVSLWNVDDKATSLLMQNFFRNLQALGEDPDVYDAFMNARRQLMEHRVESEGTPYAAPRYSNAFILIDVL